MNVDTKVSSKIFAFLRAVNVGGSNAVSMKILCKKLEAIGLTNVQTYLNSGNICFDSSNNKKLDSNYASIIETCIRNHFHLDITVLTRNVRDLKKIIEHCPYVSNTSSDVTPFDASKIGVCFLSSMPSKAQIASFQTNAPTTEQYSFFNDNIFLYCPYGFGKAKLTNALIEKLLDCRATTRNWNTVKAMLKFASKEC